jgi:hypothetical protein
MSRDNILERRWEFGGSYMYSPLKKKVHLNLEPPSWKEIFIQGVLEFHSWRKIFI